VNSLKALPPDPHILILATHWLGDTFWALQIYPFLQKRFPGAKIDVVVRPTNRWLAGLWAPPRHVFTSASLISDRFREGNPSLPAVWREARDLKRQIDPVDLVCDMTGTVVSALFSFGLQPRRTIGLCAKPFLRRLYRESRPAAAFQGHLALRPWWALAPMFSAVSGWPTEMEMLTPRLPVNLLPQDGSRHLVMFPGAGWAQKQWPLERFCNVANEKTASGWQVTLLFADNETALRESASRAVTSHVQLKTTDGTALLETLKTASLVIANDSGPAHLAAAAGVPTIVLFGPTNPVVCGPLGESVKILQSICPNLPGGVWHHCHSRPATVCKGDCWQSIPTDRILFAIDELIGKEACSESAGG
jgi:ADP-heptose:LPS heptosyltransferase